MKIRRKNINESGISFKKNTHFANNLGDKNGESNSEYKLQFFFMYETNQKGHLSCIIMFTQH